MKNATTINCSAILFDMDGVLLDSTPAVERHWREWSEKHGLAYEEVIAIAHGRPSKETMRVMAPHLDAEKEAADYEQYECEDLVGVFPISGAASFTSALPAEKWAIVTSCGHKLALARLAHVSLKASNILISADHVKQGKPHPEGYLAAAKTLGVSPAECLVVEDSPNGLKAALEAGMRCLAVLTTHEKAQLAGATHVVQTLENVLVQESNNGKITLIADLV